MVLIASTTLGSCTIPRKKIQLETIVKTVAPEYYDFEDYFKKEISETYKKEEDKAVLYNRWSGTLKFMFYQTKDELLKYVDYVAEYVLTKDYSLFINELGMAVLSGKPINIEIDGWKDGEPYLYRQESVQITPEMTEKGKEILSTYLRYKWLKFKNTDHIDKSIPPKEEISLADCLYFNINRSHPPYTKKYDYTMDVITKGKIDIVISALEKNGIIELLKEKGVKIK